MRFSLARIHSNTRQSGQNDARNYGRCPRQPQDGKSFLEVLSNQGVRTQDGNIQKKYNIDFFFSFEPPITFVADFLDEASQISNLGRRKIKSKVEKIVIKVPEPQVLHEKLPYDFLSLSRL